VQSERFSLSSSREVDGSLFWSLAPHDLSVLRCLDDSPIDIVEASARWVGVEPGLGQPANIASLKLVTARGVIASLSLSRAHDDKTRRIVLKGTDGQVTIDDLMDDDHKVLLTTGERHTFVRYEKDAPPLDREIEMWVDAVARRRVLDRNTFEDGAEVVRLIERAQRIAGGSDRRSPLEAVTA
jgi:predicted dehydrogenase